jgi:phosphinothricin acetyltransferase
MLYEFLPLEDADRTAIAAIFNYFVEHSFAAYPEETVGEDFLDWLLAMSKGYPSLCVKTEAGEVVGFGFLHAYHPAESFRRTAEITYFLLPEHTRHGVGERMLDHFIREARALGIDNLLASVSSRNEPSLRFYAKAGFERCGELFAVGRKSGRDFGVVWFQKRIG